MDDSILRGVDLKAWYEEEGLRQGFEYMRQMPEWQVFDGKGFPLALCANAAIREVMTLAFVNQMHCIRLAYLHKR
jgi:hypothetical protein